MSDRRAGAKQPKVVPVRDWRIFAPEVSTDEVWVFFNGGEASFRLSLDEANVLHTDLWRLIQKMENARLIAEDLRRQAESFPRAED